MAIRTTLPEEEEKALEDTSEVDAKVCIWTTLPEEEEKALEDVSEVVVKVGYKDDLT